MYQVPIINTRYLVLLISRLTAGMRGTVKKKQPPRKTMRRPRARNPSIHLHLQQPRDENGNPPGRYRPQGVKIPTPPADSKFGWGSSGSQRAMRVSPRDKVEVPSRSGTITSHPRASSPSTHLQLQQPGNETGHPSGRFRPARCANPNLTR